MEEVLKTEPKDKYLQQDVGLKDNDDVLDYLQEVINKISDDEEFMKDLRKSNGSGKINFFKKYLQTSTPFRYNYIIKIKRTAWNMFLDTNENLKTDFETEPEPVKEVKKANVENAKSYQKKQKEKAIGAKFDEEKNKEEEKEKKKKMEEAKRNKRKKKD
jgi:hypothetical protein